jgi:hypothetical protein
MRCHSIALKLLEFSKKALFWGIDSIKWNFLLGVIVLKPATVKGFTVWHQYCFVHARRKTINPLIS